VVTINVIDGPNAGTNSAISLCEGDSNPIDLFGSLEGSPEAGGTWSDIDGTGVDLSDPSAVIFSGLTNNTYEFAYTIMGSGICNDAVSLLSVTIIDGANAGMGSSAFLCLNATNDDINLFVLLNGTPDTGGFWTDDDASGLDLSDPMSVDFTSLPIGGYNFTYTVAGVGLCPSSSATVAVEINTSPNPGMNSLNPICNSGSPVVNFDELLGTHDSGGTWTDDDAIGVDISDPSQVSFDGVPLGVYDFTYSIPSVGSCPEVSATINIQITPGPNAGEGSTVELCQDENLIINLEAELTGNPKTIGVWSDENNSGVDLSTPDNVDLGDLMPGVYNYVYEVTTSVNCDPDSAIVEITILGSVSPGDDASTSVCFGSTVDLENLLINNDLIGSFVDPNSTGALSGSMVNTSLLTEGESYTFIHQVSGPDNCNMTTEAELTIMVVAAVSAGENVQAQICPSQDISLVDYLDNADLGGMFLDNDNTGLLSGNIFMVPESGTFNFTYQIGDGIDCPVSFSNLVLEVIEAPVVNFSLDTEVCAGACEVLSITAASADIIEGMILIMTDENGNEEDTQIVFQQSSTFMLPICYTNDGIFSFDNLEEGTYTLSVLPIDYQGCTFDLGVSLMITAEEQSTELIDDVLCPGEFIMVNGTEYNEDNPSGMETEIEDNGCEKMITIALTFLQDADNDIVESLCNDESIMVNNVVYDQDNPIGQEIIENAAANGCDSIVNIDLSFEQEFVLETMIDCNDIESSSVSFSSAAVNSAPYSVLIDNEPAIIVNALPFVFDLSEGMHTIVITDVEGCSFVENITIDIDAIDIEIVSTMISDNMFSLTVMSNIVLDNYNWSPAEFLSCTDCPNPIATISGTQDILLNATYGSNCDVSDQISLTEIVNEIENTDIYMPTIFSPNNDGINDNFTIYTEEARLITTFQVYDRWGNRVFMSNNIETNNEEAGWDGKFKTKKLDPGVYTYFAELIFSDADRRIVKGSVTLMK
jgi:gliding motility-associated-like protein